MGRCEVSGGLGGGDQRVVGWWWPWLLMLLIEVEKSFGRGWVVGGGGGGGGSWVEVDGKRVCQLLGFIVNGRLSHADRSTHNSVAHRSLKGGGAFNSSDVV